MSHEPPDPFADNLRAQLEAALARAEAAEQEVKELEARAEKAEVLLTEYLGAMGYLTALAPSMTVDVNRPMAMAIIISQRFNTERARIREGLEELTRWGEKTRGYETCFERLDDGNYLDRADALALVEKPEEPR